MGRKGEGRREIGRKVGRDEERKEGMIRGGLGRKKEMWKEGKRKEGEEVGKRRKGGIQEMRKGRKKERKEKRQKGRGKGEGMKVGWVEVKE